MKTIKRNAPYVLIVIVLVVIIYVVPSFKKAADEIYQTRSDTAVIMKALKTTDVSVTFIFSGDYSRTYDVRTSDQKYLFAVCTDGKDLTGCKVYSYVGEATSK